MIDYKILSDEELADLFKSGDRGAFTVIFHKYWTPLVLHANNLLKDEDMAQDIVQDLFTWMVNSPEKWQIRTQLKYYLYSSVRLKVINAIRNEKVKSNYLDKLTEYVPTTHADSDFRLKELIGLIDSEILNMPPRMQEIFNLSRKRHLSHREIAEMLNISENTVKMQIKRALQMLRNNKEIDSYLAVLIVTLIGSNVK